MLEVKPFRQKPGYCGPACLKMVAYFYGIKKREKALVKLCGCTPSKGISAEGLVKVAKEIGLEGFVQDFSEIKDLEHYVHKKNIPVIVDWFSDDEGHYSVVVDIDKENIYLQDPSLGYLRAMKIKKFKRVWFDFPGDFLKSKDDMILRRMVVIYKEGAL